MRVVTVRRAVTGNLDKFIQARTDRRRRHTHASMHPHARTCTCTHARRHAHTFKLAWVSTCCDHAGSRCRRRSRSHRQGESRRRCGLFQVQLGSARKSRRRCGRLQRQFCAVCGGRRAQADVGLAVGIGRSNKGRDRRRRAAHRAAVRQPSGCPPICAETTLGPDDAPPGATYNAMQHGMQHATHPQAVFRN